MAARSYEISLRVLKYFQHEKRKFVSASDHVSFFLLYKILTIQQILYFVRRLLGCLGLISPRRHCLRQFAAAAKAEM